jgi:hypothetical protein
MLLLTGSSEGSFFHTVEEQGEKELGDKLLLK